MPAEAGLGREVPEEIEGNLRNRRYSTGFFMKQMNRTKNIFKCDQ